jgi:hypothetical protein
MHRAGDLDDASVEPGTLMRALVPDHPEHLVIGLEMEDRITVHGDTDRLPVSQLVKSDGLGPSVRLVQDMPYGQTIHVVFRCRRCYQC